MLDWLPEDAGLTIEPFTLEFIKPGTTSRGTMHKRSIWYLYLRCYGVTGIGEIAPLPGLSREYNDNFEEELNHLINLFNRKDRDTFMSNIIHYPSIRMGFEMAAMDLLGEGKRIWFDSPFSKKEKAIQINGLIWMGEKEDMIEQFNARIEEGFRSVKFKIGGLDFASEWHMLDEIRQYWPSSKLEIRLDANGAFTADEVEYRLSALSKFEIHSIEQPVKPGQMDVLRRLCKKNIVPIALDEELISHREYAEKLCFLNYVQPHYLVLKPSLLGGFVETDEWISAADELGIKWWVTSSLESNIGLSAIAQWVSLKNSSMLQGLGTGRLFSNNPDPQLKVLPGGWLTYA